MEVLFALFLWALNFLPAIIMTVIVFCINPILGVLLGLFFFLVAVVTAVVQIYKIMKNK